MLIIVECQMAIPAVIREYPPDYCHNTRNPMRHPPQQEMTPESLHGVQSNSMFPIKHIKSLNVLDGTQESPQENSHKTRGTLLSPQECKLVRCTPSQLEMRPNFLSLAP